MKILQIIDSLNYGGAEILLLGLTRKLQKLGHHVSVAFCTPGPLAKDFEQSGISLHHLSRLSRVDPFLLIRICKLIHELAPEVVHTHLFKSDFHGRIAGYLCGTPVVVSTLHSNDTWAQKAILGRVYGFTARFSHRVIAVSEDVRAFHIKYTHISPGRIITIKNGIEIGRYTDTKEQGLALRKKMGIPESAFVIGIIGRLVQDKGVSIFLEAASIIKASYPNSVFFIVGDGVLRESLTGFARDYEIEKDVRFLGFRDDIPDVLAALNILVFSSFREGLPLTLLEGMASSKPVVATKVGAIPSLLVDGETGFLVETNDPKAIAERCIDLLKTPSLMEDFGEAGRIRIEHEYDLDQMVHSTVGLYKSLMEKTRA